MIEKLPDALGIHVRRDGYDSDLQGIELCLEPGERRHFLFTGSAPGCPKIHEHDFTCQILRAEGFPVESFEMEGGDRSTGCHAGYTEGGERITRVSTRTVER